MQMDSKGPTSGLLGGRAEPLLSAPQPKTSREGGDTGLTLGSVGSQSEAGLSRGPQGQLGVQLVTDAVYWRLRSGILEGMAPGSALRLSEIASELGVSTTPVRVALERLAADGLVIRSGRRGATVAPLSLTDFYDIYAIRRGLEGTAARFAAPLLSHQAGASMQDDVRTLDEMARDSSVRLDAYLATEWHMRMTCFMAAGHRRLLEAIESYRRQAERYLRLVFTSSDNFLADLEYQHLFCDTCISGDPDASESIAQRQMDWTVQHVAPMLQAMEHG